MIGAKRVPHDTTSDFECVIKHRFKTFALLFFKYRAVAIYKVICRLSHFTHLSHTTIKRLDVVHSGDTERVCTYVLEYTCITISLLEISFV